MNTATLIRMATQIASNFSAYPKEVATAKVASHMKENWDPCMLKALFARVETDSIGIDAVVLNATQALKA